MPLHDIDRPRSVSNASQVSPHITGRRPSVEQAPQAYQQPSAQQYPSAMTPQTPQGMYPPQMAPQWQQPPPPVNTYMQPPQTFSQPSYQSSPVAAQYNNFAPPQYPSYEQSNGHMRHNSGLEYPAPPSGPPPPVPASQGMSYPSSSQTMAPFGQMDAYGRPVNASMQSSPSSHQPMPMQPQYPAAPGHSAMGSKHDSISPYQTQPPASSSHDPHGYYSSAVAPPKFQNVVQPTGATKRTYEASFDVSHMDQPLRQGARPAASPVDTKYAYAIDGADEDPHTPLDEAAMSYRRADGTERRRRLPSMLT